MTGLEHIHKIRMYCDYVEEHLLNVERSWRIFQIACAGLSVVYDDYKYWSIDAMVRAHDISKMSVEEFIPYQRNFYPTDGQEKDPAEFAAAWEHHKSHNPHHWENWTTLNPPSPYEQEFHCVCMVIDWMAMGLKFGDTAEEYYERHKDEIKLPEWAVEFIMVVFKLLKAHAEHQQSVSTGRG